jgi:hypothetical protein
MNPLEFDARGFGPSPSGKDVVPAAVDIPSIVAIRKRIDPYSPLGDFVQSSKANHGEH